MKNDPVFKFVAAAIIAAVCTAFYSATHFKTQALYRDAVVAQQTDSPAPNFQTTHPGALRHPS